MSAMFSKDIVALDVSSRRITAMVGCKKAQSVYDVKVRLEREYDGYSDGAFFDEEQLAGAVTDILSEALSQSGIATRRVYVGVPGEFVTLVNRPVTVTLDRVRRVVDADISYLIAKGGAFDDPDRVLIGSSAVSYSVDTSDKQFFDVRGMNAGRVSATVSYMLADRSFTELVESAVRKAGFREIRFVASAWAECVAMFEREQRDAAYVVIDAGYLSSSVAIGRGEGLQELKSFSMGGGHVAADIYEVLDIPFELAEEAKELVDLNLSYSPDAVLVADGEHIVYAAEACEIVRARLEYFAEIVAEVIASADVPGYIPVYLTGEGFSAIRGARSVIADKLGRPVELTAPKVPGFTRPDDSSALSLFVVAETMQKPGSALDILKRVFNGGKK